LSIVIFDFLKIFLGGFELTIIDRIFKLINESNLTAKEFAKKVGVSQGNITDWKTGRAKPSVDALLKISNACNVSVDYLLGNTDKTSYVDTLVRYLKPLKFSEKEFEGFKKASIGFLNSQSPETIATGFDSFSDVEKDKILNGLEIISDLSSEYDKSARLNKIRYSINKVDSNYEPVGYETLIEDSDIDSIVKAGLLEAINNINKNSIIAPEISQFYMCPVYGQISAGIPNWAEECIEGRIPIDPELMNILNPEECFFLRVNGESMNKEIKNGAYALIRKQEAVENGEIAVVLVNGYDATLKKFSKQGDIIILEPMSNDPSFSVQIYNKETEITVIGKYIGKMEMK